MRDICVVVWLVVWARSAAWGSQPAHYRTCFAEVAVTANTIAVLRRLFASYGLPEQIVSDNGPQFTSAEFIAFTQANGVKHLRCSPYHPSSNGLAGRFVRMFEQTMAAGKHDGQTLQQRLANFLLSYCTTPHAITGVAPCTLFLDRNIRTRFDLLKPNLRSSVAGKQAGIY